MSLLTHHFVQQRSGVAPPPSHSLAKQLQSIKLPTARSQSPSPSPSPSPPTASTFAPGPFASLAAAARRDTHGWEDLSDEEVLLRKFDTDLAYGPCVGQKQRKHVPTGRCAARCSRCTSDSLTSSLCLLSGVSRLERWQRAEALGLQPPAYVPQILETAGLNDAAAAKPTTLKHGVATHSFLHTHV